MTSRYRQSLFYRLWYNSVLQEFLTPWNEVFLVASAGQGAVEDGFETAFAVVLIHA